MPHIFISYSKKDSRPLAEKLFQTISAMEGFSAWMDKSLEAAESWAWQIQDEIEKADLVLVLLSPDVNRRPSETQRRSFVLNEIDFAQQLHKPILPMMAEQTIAPVQIAGLEYIDLTGDVEQGLGRLYARLEKLRPAPPAAPMPEIKDEPIQAPPPVVETPKPIVEEAVPELKVMVLPDNPKPKVLSEKPKRDVASKSSNRQAVFLGSLVLLLLVVGIGAYYFWMSNFGAVQAIEIDYPPEIESAMEAAENFDGRRNSDWEVVTYTFPDGVEMALVPAGCFMMGSSEAEIQYAVGLGTDAINLTEEQPQNRVCFDTPFWMDVYEVSQGDFRRLGGEQELTSANPGDNLPVEKVSVGEAFEYCVRQGKWLPSQSEWEYAARGIESWIFPWGDSFRQNLVNYCDESCGEDWRDTSYNDGYASTAPVGSFDNASWVGAFDMAGNVREYTARLDYDRSQGRATLFDARSLTPSLRGGSWFMQNHNQRSAARGQSIPANSNIGFRCLREIE